MNTGSRVSSEYESGLAFDTEQPITMRHFLGTNEKSSRHDGSNNSAFSEEIEMTPMGNHITKDRIVRLKNENSISIVEPVS